MLYPFRGLFERPDHEELKRRLARPEGMVDVVLDTDCYNEIDDQFAISYMVRSPEKFSIKAITAAPFVHGKDHKVIRALTPKEGMEKSYEEVLRLLSKLGREDMNSLVVKGAERYLPDELTPVDSPAVRKIIELSKNYDKTHPLYVIAIGAITNVASALLTDRSILDRIVVLWLGGHALHIGGGPEYNLKQDIAGARVLFGSGVPLIMLPCLGVVSEFRFSKVELDYWFAGKNNLCTYLINEVYSFAKINYSYEGWSKVIWDVIAIAWFISGDYVIDGFIDDPMPGYDCSYETDPDPHPIRYVSYVRKDPVIRDLAKKLTENEG